MDKYKSKKGECKLIKSIIKTWSIDNKINIFCLKKSIIKLQ